MTNESPFRKNRAYYIGVVLTVLEGILSGCSYLSVYIVLTALASGTITAGMVGAVTAALSRQSRQWYLKVKYQPC